MKNLLIIIGLIIILSAFASLKTRSTPSPKQAKTYRFRRKQFIMTKAENDFYRALQAAVGSHYMIYPQAHLDLFLDHKVEKQSRKGALSTIQRKSVDFLICNRQYYNPLVAIELDDGSHARPERKERDEKLTQYVWMPVCPSSISNGSSVTMKLRSYRNFHRTLRRFNLEELYQAQRLLSQLCYSVRDMQNTQPSRKRPRGQTSLQNTGKKDAPVDDSGDILRKFNKSHYASEAELRKVIDTIVGYTVPASAYWRVQKGATEVRSPRFIFTFAPIKPTNWLLRIRRTTGSKR